eukprot:TRINITY_DN3242_c0_g1_i7.p1 TRINITY_DN3242_c0_g1~~TRINITY_DN3242_c0_g1_i7.p1  ORF type:complete len:201 (+),score=42.57 TRINITY_DN3242_c0_g1_i7:251-853(+)
MRGASPAAAAAALARRRAERYKCRCRQAETYTDAAQPVLTAIVQSFNHVANVPNISAALVGSAAIEEIVVCEDGSSDGSLAAWRAALTRPNDFIIRSNNLHELRSYNRAMRMASGDVVVLLQDDDLPPPDGPVARHGVGALSGQARPRLAWRLHWPNVGPRDGQGRRIWGAVLHPRRRAQGQHPTPRLHGPLHGRAVYVR